MSPRRPGLGSPAGIFVLLALLLVASAGAQESEALLLDYGPLLDRAALTHSGQTVGEVHADLKVVHEVTIAEMVEPWKNL